MKSHINMPEDTSDIGELMANIEKYKEKLEKDGFRGPVNEEENSIDIFLSGGVLYKPFMDYKKIIVGPWGEIYPDEINTHFQECGKRITNILTPEAFYYFQTIKVIYTFKINTMATDSAALYINPLFVMDIINKSVEKYGPGEEWRATTFVVIHELFHNICNHTSEFQKFIDTYSNHDFANIAMDLEINSIIANSIYTVDADGDYVFPFEHIVDDIGGLQDNRLMCRRWTTIYPMIIKLTENPANIKTVPSFIPGMKPTKTIGYAERDEFTEYEKNSILKAYLAKIQEMYNNDQLSPKMKRYYETTNLVHTS